MTIRGHKKATLTEFFLLPQFFYKDHIHNPGGPLFTPQGNINFYLIKPIFEKIIMVKASPLFIIKTFLRNYWQWTFGRF
jgi:hypothetical protein